MAQNMRWWSSRGAQRGDFGSGGVHGVHETQCHDPAACGKGGVRMAWHARREKCGSVRGECSGEFTGSGCQLGGDLPGGARGSARCKGAWMGGAHGDVHGGDEADMQGAHRRTLLNRWVAPWSTALARPFESAHTNRHTERSRSDSEKVQV